VQSTCNYITLWLRNTASMLADPLSTGTRLRFIPVVVDDVPGEESVPSQHPYLTPNTNVANQHGPLHVDPYPNTASPGQVRECSAGNEPYSASAPVIGNPAADVGAKTQSTTKGKGP
jgi:hypothetical protein